MFIEIPDVDTGAVCIINTEFITHIGEIENGCIIRYWWGDSMRTFITCISYEHLYSLLDVR